MNSPQLPTVSHCRILFQHVSDAVAVFGDDAELVFGNAAFDRLQQVSQSQLRTLAKTELLQATVASHSRELILDISSVQKIRLADGIAFVVSDTRYSNSASEEALRHISMALQDTQDIYFAAAQAIHQCLGWRWVAITRFVSASRLQVLAFSDKQNSLTMDEYDIAGTPCELVVNSNRFTLYSDLLQAFPDYQALHDLGALTYAGLVYRGSDNKPLGHVMVMDEQRDVDFALAEDVISSVTLALSSHFQLHQVQERLEAVQNKANEDGLTGVGNRYAFEQLLQKLAEQHQNTNNQSACNQTNWSMAVVDLDYLKYLNDNMGHQTGDRFIKLMAQELSTISRQSDSVFRIGGDEFVILLRQSSSAFLLSFYQRFRRAINRIRSILRFGVDASIGIASLQETDFDVDAWLALADKRMYQDKQSRRKAS